MSSIASRSEQLMLSTVIAIVLTGAGDPSQRMWRTILSECLPDAHGCDDDLSPIWIAARALVDAREVAARNAAEFRLRFELRTYMQKRAARAYEAYRGTIAGAN